MANETSFSANLSASKGGASVTGSFSKTADMSGNEMTSLVQSQSTSSVQLDFGGIDALGYVFIKNLDAAINVDIALDSGNPQKVSTLKPGEGCLLSNPPLALYGRAASGTPDLFIVSVEA